jgi:hypothetical protein
MRALITLGLMAASALMFRWTGGVSTLRQDKLYALRAVGACERVLTRVDAWLQRVKVWLYDRLEIDRVLWLSLRARYTPEMS